MRRRLLVAIAVVAAVAVALFALPLAQALRSNSRDQELPRLQRDAVSDTRSVDLDPTEPDGIELPTSGDRVGVYGLDGRRITGDGPLRGDPVVQGAVAGREAHAGKIGAELIAAVPLVTRERVSGVLRVARDAGVVDRRVRSAWWLLAILAVALILLALGAAWLIARRLAGPLERLAETAGDLGHGTHVPEIPVSGMPEADAIGAALTASAQRIREMGERERAFSTHASHQLRTPLAALRIDLEAVAMRDHPPPAETHAALAQVDRLETTIGTLLSAARDLPTGPAGADLGDLLQATAGGWRTTLECRGRALALGLPDGRTPIRAHAPVVREILEILVDNAIVHGDGTVTVSARWEGDDWITVEVRDEGVGLDGDPGAPFIRAADAREVDHGIGLPLARALATAEGGTLTLTNPGPGPCFTLRLPTTERNE
ncbi:MAG: HAMP domain-containing histidine kinase [Actinobacteria bacterium]|nr:HAMP domain-containing histidine kinase [Thermoleophilia bacterium]MCB9011294.1 HAMP domain-containing histidine kinase [Actinomycetota bacterium]